MPSGAYSQYFLHGRGPAGTRNYQVPQGYRALVRGIMATTWASGGGAYFYIGGTLLWYWQSQGANQSSIVDLRAVCYAGSTIQFLTDGTDTSFHVSGYLLLDGDGPKGAQSPRADLPPSFDPIAPLPGVPSA